MVSDSPKPPPSVIANPWQQLRQLTAARIALGRTGASLPTQPHLAFQLAHARARDAVHQALDVAQLLQAFERAGLTAGSCEVLESAAPDRHTYLQRPDFGRRLSERSRARLQALATERLAAGKSPGHDLAFVVADGLSARAVMTNAAPLLAAVWPQLVQDGWSIAPVAIVQQARVAIGDEVAQLVAAELVVVLIGERPGLSSPDSLGAYLTWKPHVGLTDASRNCISNIRPAGLACEEASAKLLQLVTDMRQRQLSGVQLKDEGPSGAVLVAKTNFLLGYGR